MILLEGWCIGATPMLEEVLNTPINQLEAGEDAQCIWWRYMNNQLSHHQIFNALKNRIAIRKQQKAFHPNATQFTLHFGTEIFGFWRQCIDRQSSIFLHL